MTHERSAGIADDGKLEILLRHGNGTTKAFHSTFGKVGHCVSNSRNLIFNHLLQMGWIGLDQNAVPPVGCASQKSFGAALCRCDARSDRCTAGGQQDQCQPSQPERPDST